MSLILRHLTQWVNGMTPATPVVLIQDLVDRFSGWSNQGDRQGSRLKSCKVLALGQKSK
jgi:hypothetical protein